ncbi:MAG: acylneuraminate cytidylyltransferase family protein [Thermodesulfobacteriota bacterium]
MRQLHISNYSATRGIPFLPPTPLAPDEDLAPAGTLTVGVDLVHPQSATILNKFDKVIYVVQDIREFLWHSVGINLALTKSRPPRPEEIRALVRDRGALIRMYWNEQVLSHLLLLGPERLTILRLEELARDFPAQAQKFAALTGGSLPSDLELDAILDNPTLPARTYRPGNGPQHLGALVEAECLRDCSPTLAMCGYDTSPGCSGKVVGAPSFTCSAETIRGMLRAKALRPDVANLLMCAVAPEKAKTVVVIPARSGSKRIPDKNIADVCGVPLMALTIRMAKQTPGVDMVVVNTDSPVYAELAREHGAQTPFLRPCAISGDDASLGDATEFCLRSLLEAGIHVNKLLTMYPTSPFRNPETVAAMIAALDTYSLAATALPTTPAWDELYTETGEGLIPVRNFLRNAPPSGTLIKQTGAMQGRSYVNTDMGVQFFLLLNPFECIDVDTPEDLELVRRVAAMDQAMQGVAPC